MTPSSQTKRRRRLGATPERDPANELYDQACSLLQGAQGLRAAAGSRRSAPAIAASLGCIEASLEEIEVAVAEMRAATVTQGARSELRIRAVFAQLSRDLVASRSSCAAARETVGPALASS